MQKFIRKHFILCAAAVVALSFYAPSRAQERIQLTTPEAAPSNTHYRVDDFSLRPDDPDILADTAVLSIRLISVPRRETVNCVYSASTSPTATVLITGLNKANLSTAYAGNANSGSLTQRIFHRLIVMGESTAVCGKTLTGSLTGSPQ